MTKLSPNAELVHNLLTGLPIIGRRPDLAELTDAELGTLAGLALGPHPDHVLVMEFLSVLLERTPVFDADSAVATLVALAKNAKQSVEPGEPTLVQWMLETASQVVAGCATIGEVGVQRALGRLLALGMGPYPDVLYVALLSCANQDMPEHPDELVRDEWRFMCNLEAPRDRIAMARIREQWRFGVDDEELDPRGADPLALLPGYLSFAEALTAKALERVRAIQAGTTPYAPDKAFSVNEAQTLRCALQAGLDQDAQWASEAAIPLLAGVSIAPLLKAKTAPSQSASIAVAKAIAERPSASLAAGMRATIADVRHAGLKKKLGRFSKTAQRRLFEHDAFLLELNPSAKIPKALSGATVRALEALYLRASPIPFNLWRSNILGNNAIAQHAGALVWRLDGGGDVLPVPKGKSWSFIGHDEQLCSPAADSVTLWHPLQPQAEASAWRNLVLKHKLQQPFNQVFRETYTEQSIPLFFGLELDIRTLLGLARSQGWVLRHDGLARRLGPYRVELDMGRIFPGARGSTRCYSMGIFHGASQQKVDLSSEEPQALSECCRAVDLLVSVSASALAPEDARETSSARERRAVLVRMLGSSPAAGRPFVEGRYVRAGGLSISIATGRASRGGEELEAPTADAGIVVIPYPDEILQRIVAALNRTEDSP